MDPAARARQSAIHLALGLGLRVECELAPLSALLFEDPLDVRDVLSELCLRARFIAESRRLYSTEVPGGIAVEFGHALEREETPVG